MRACVASSCSAMASPTQCKAPHELHRQQLVRHFKRLLHCGCMYTLQRSTFCSRHCTWHCIWHCNCCKTAVGKKQDRCATRRIAKSVTALAAAADGKQAHLYKLSGSAAACNMQMRSSAAARYRLFAQQLQNAFRQLSSKQQLLRNKIGTPGAAEIAHCWSCCCLQLLHEKHAISFVAWCSHLLSLLASNSALRLLLPQDDEGPTVLIKYHRHGAAALCYSRSSRMEKLASAVERWDPRLLLQVGLAPARAALLLLCVDCAALLQRLLVLLFFSNVSKS
jgi:hypothetical protein